MRSVRLIAEQHDFGRWQRCAAARHVKGGDINAIGDAIERGGLGDERERERIHVGRQAFAPHIAATSASRPVPAPRQSTVAPSSGGPCASNSAISTLPGQSTAP